MPWGLALLVGFSVLVFRRARRAGRNPLFWIFVLWFLTIGTGFIFAVVGGVLAMLQAEKELSDQDIRSALFVPTLAGMFLGSVVTAWACGHVSSDQPPP